MESSSQTTGEPAYPVRFSVEYPDRELNRLTTAFRLIVAIPILIVAGSIGGHEGSLRGGRARLEDRRRDRRAAVPGAAADDRVPAEVPALVVRLEPRAAPVLEPDRRLPRPDGRPLPIHRRAAGGRARPPLPGREAGAQPLAAARQVAARDPPLHRARLPLDRGRRVGGNRLVRDPLHRPLPPRPLRLRRSASSAGPTASSATRSSS